jgi:hypothetical protein
LGGNLRVQELDHVQTFLQNILADLDIPTEAERACEQERDEDPAVMFLANSDRQYYGSLIRDIENEYTQ